MNFGLPLSSAADSLFIARYIAQQQLSLECPVPDDVKQARAGARLRETFDFRNVPDKRRLDF